MGKGILYSALFGFFGFVGLSMLLSGCGGGHPKLPVPAIQNINSSTTPTSPVGLPVEINGSGFGTSPGKVTFTQGNISVDVVPAGSVWSDTGIVAAVPTGNGVTNFTVPGTVDVTVRTGGGTSNVVTVNLVATLTFNPSKMAWLTTLPLPTALTGLRAVAVPGTNSTSAFAVVTGGFDGSVNTKTVWSINLNQDGTVGNTTNTTWQTIKTQALTTTLAFHAMAEADDTNSLVPLGDRFIYVIGGQVNTGDTSGTDAIYEATVDSSSGEVGMWTQLTNSLPQPLLGESATVHNGYLYVVGGLDKSGNPVATVYSAPINSDGTIGTWTTSTNSLTSARAFGSVFVFGDTIYYIDGEVNPTPSPNDQGLGDTSVYYASAVRGVVGSWTLNANLTIANRAKGVLFTAFGQVISGEGVYTGNPGSKEMETSTINSSNTTNAALNPWTGLTGTQVAGANVYNAAGITSPIVSTSKAPRFLILGGQAFTTTTGPGGSLSNTVYYNSAP